MVGRLDDAEALLERLIIRGFTASCGNIPQAFSHVGLVNTAYIIEESAQKFDRHAQHAAVH